MGFGKNQDCKIRGTVAPGFESVWQLYERNMQSMEEEHTQLCVYHRGQKVVDLWASASGDSDFSADSLVNIFSSGKSLEAIAIASLVDKGLLDYKAKISSYWPEFGAKGKADVTVADLMRHEAGLANFNTSIDPEDLLAAKIKGNTIGSIIEGHEQRFPGEGQRGREYHALTRGWIANEVFRRVDPAGRTIGEFLREDISGPMGADVIIGLREEELSRVSRVSVIGFGFHFLESLKPRIFGRKVVHNFFQLMGRLIRLIPAMRKGPSSPRPPAPYTGMKDFAFFNKKSVAMGETPSANANCSARGLGKIAAMMSAGGTFENKTYLREQAWKALHAEPLEERLGSLIPTRFTQGGVAQFTRCQKGSSNLEREFNVGREGFYGWMGLGGSILQWHPELDIGFAFVPTKLHVLDFLNERGKTYQAEVLRCVKATMG